MGLEENDVFEQYANDTTFQLIKKYIDTQRDVDNNRMNNVRLLATFVILIIMCILV